VIPGRIVRRIMCVSIAGVFCLLPTLMVSASGGAACVVRYQVSSMGMNIGDVTTTQRMTKDGETASLHFETRTALKASFLWMGYQQATIEKGIINKQDLVSYSRKGQENGTAIDIEGRLENAAFRFDVREQGATRSVVIPRSSYDYTTMECPEARLDFSGKKQVALRVLDVEKLAVVKREYRLVRTTDYVMAGKEYPCRIVDFSDQNKKARRWIAWDGSTAVVYRQDGRGEKNSYSVQATSLTGKM
jgi:hypothetical protein